MMEDCIDLSGEPKRAWAVRISGVVYHGQFEYSSGKEEKKEQLQELNREMHFF